MLSSRLSSQSGAFLYATTCSSVNGCNPLCKPNQQEGRNTLEPRLIDLLVFFARHPGKCLTGTSLSKTSGPGTL